MTSTWNSTPARGPWDWNGLKSWDDTVTTRAEFAHFDARRENDMPLMHSSDGFVLVGTTWMHVSKIWRKRHRITKWNIRVKGLKGERGGREGVRASALPVHPGTCKTSSNCDLAQLCQVHSLRLFHQQTLLFCNLPQVSAHVLSVLQPPVRSTAICDISKSMHHILSYTKQTSSWALNHYLPSPQYADTSKEHSRYFKILK